MAAAPSRLSAEADVGFVALAALASCLGTEEEAVSDAVPTESHTPLLAVAGPVLLPAPATGGTTAVCACAIVSPNFRLICYACAADSLNWSAPVPSPTTPCLAAVLGRLGVNDDGPIAPAPSAQPYDVEDGAIEDGT